MSRVVEPPKHHVPVGYRRVEEKFLRSDPKPARKPRDKKEKEPR